MNALGIGSTSLVAIGIKKPSKMVPLMVSTRNVAPKEPTNKYMTYSMKTAIGMPVETRVHQSPNWTRKEFRGDDVTF